MHDIADGEFDDLAALGARDVGDLQYLGRNMARRGIAADLLFGPRSSFRPPRYAASGIR